VAAALLGVERGAHLVRVHDVAATVAALKVHQAARDIQASETVQTSQTVAD
jgi:dihydropteroate synthase